jgi:hypothetical protein
LETGVGKQSTLTPLSDPGAHLVLDTGRTPPAEVCVRRCLEHLGVSMGSICDLTTQEAYRLVADHFGHELPPLDAVENEDWGRDYVLQHFQRHSEEELAAAGLTWQPSEDST